MTAVAGILNKQGVAIAADSAVTVSGLQNRKVYNSANKIFTLSKFHPVGIAIYNNAQFMGIPWEILIKEYRKFLGNKSFSKLSEYKDSFFEWLSDNNYFIIENNNDFLFSDLLSFLQVILNEALKKNNGNKENLEDELLKLLNTYVKSEIPKHSKIESLKNLNKKNTEALIKTFIPNIINILYQNTLVSFKKEKIEPLLIEAYYAYITHDQFIQYTGLIFTGYGETELFPQLLPVNVSIVIDGKLRYNIDQNKTATINNKQNACIRPFAQTDVIDTILQGVSPELNNLSAIVFGDFIKSFIEEIKSIHGMPQIVQKHLNTLNTNEYVKKYQIQFNNIVSQKYVNPLMGAVSQLSKEDLAEMAESLVYLTYLKRRFTMAEESVGGPVDIAVITKGDGFIWIKRKHYFNPELNQPFFQKYF
ncbi:MAG: hypothetical protein HS119_02215 [Flavobacteriales bacterium]|jgi:hypothetical protein|nr:hypothetical protein [Flavobacteriales bacterium]MCL4856448.1 hypothetical protein [Flavobacteriales bacterium]